MTEKDHSDPRLYKLDILREKLGVDPYPGKALKVIPISSLLRNGETEDKQSTAGRLKSKREHGKTVFADIQDEGETIQLYFRKDDFEESLWEITGNLDLGDLIYVEGPVFTTRTGELTIKVVDLRILCKAIKQIPVVKTDADGKTYDSVSDPDFLYRHRCVDLFVRPESRERFLIRSRLLKSVRSYFEKEGFIEVETPVLQPLYGGAAADPFITRYNVLDEKYYLRIAKELYLKRLLAGGINRVFEIGKDFRNEGIDRTHSPEFTQLELYEAYADYGTMMNRFEELVSWICRELGIHSELKYQGKDLSIAPPFDRVCFAEILKKTSGEDLLSWSAKDLMDFADLHGLKSCVEKRASLLDKLFDHFVVPELVFPTFVIDYPEELSPLAKHKPGFTGITERFEVFIAGLEIANAFTEQNDPVYQRNRLEEQALESSNREGIIDEDFLYALEIGMPPAGGMGIGIDRLVMLLTDARSIRDTILFPQLRRKEEK